MKAQDCKLYHDKLLPCIQELYKKKFKSKVPITLNKLSKELLLVYPTKVFIKVIEIKTYTEKAEKELDDCFPGDYYPDDNDIFKAQIYKFLFENTKNFESNEVIIQGLELIIKNLSDNSIVKKYITLIDIITQSMNAENRLLCELLASNPFKYKELVYYVDSNLNLSPLPKAAKDFYSLSNYNNNKNTFTKFFKDEQIEKLRQEFLSQISLQNNKIENLNNEIIKLKEESKVTKVALFNIQIRDIIKSFLDYLIWALHVKKTDNDISDIKEALKEIEVTETKGGKMIIQFLNNLYDLKQAGNDEGHHFKNIEFDIALLPDEIREKYLKYKVKENCGIRSCDCIALLLSINEINDSSDYLTKKKYDFFSKLFEIPVKDWASNKLKVIELLKSYEN